MFREQKHISPSVESPPHPDDATSLRYKFRHKTWEQLNDGKEPVSITTVQAAMILIAVLMLDGRSSDALALEEKLQSMCEDLALFDSEDDESAVVLEESSIEERVRDSVLWSIHNYMTFQRSAAKMPSPWPPTPPSRLTLESSRLAIGTGSVVDCFQDVATTEVYGVAAFQAYSSMASLQARITLAKFDKDDRFDLYTAGLLYNDLVRCMNNLPELMRPESPSPHALAFHLICYSWILDIFYHFKGAMDLVPVHGLKLGGKGLSTVTGIVALSRSQISRGIQIYRTNFGFARGPMPMLQVMFLSCIHLIRDIKDDGTVEMLSNVVGAMREMSQSFWIEKQVLKSVAKMLVVHKDDLPTDVQECLWEWEEDKKLGEDETRDDKMWDVERRLAAMQAMMDSMTLEKE